MIFFLIFFWSPVSRIVPKNVKEGPLEVFEHPFFCKIEKNEGGNPFKTFKKFAKKISQSRKNLHKKFLVKDDNLNSSSAKDSQGLVRTSQVLDQSLHVPLLALQVLDQSLPVLGNPGDTLPRTGTRNNPEPIQVLKGPNRCRIESK